MIIKDFRNEIPVVKWLSATRKNDWQQMSIKTTALLEGRRADFGGLDLHVCIVRYPEMIDARELTMSCEVEAFQQGVTPLYVKAIQADGHMAWSSPVYVAEENAAPV